MSVACQFKIALGCDVSGSYSSLSCPTELFAYGAKQRLFFRAGTLDLPQGH
jgi:hypothetical protein